MAGPLYGLKRSQHARMSGLSRIGRAEARLKGHNLARSGRSEFGERPTEVDPGCVKTRPMVGFLDGCGGIGWGVC